MNGRRGFNPLKLALCDSIRSLFAPDAQLMTKKSLPFSPRGSAVFILIAVFSLVAYFPAASRAGGRVQVALGPSVTTDMIARYMRNSGILKKWGEEVGVDFEMKTTLSANLRIAQNQAQIVLLSTIDIARLAVDDGLELVIWGKDSTSYEGLYAKAGRPGESPGDFKGKRLVHPGWNTRATRIGKVILAALSGVEAETDFEIVTAPWRIGPEKLIEDEADVAINAMPFVLKSLLKKKLRSVGKSFAREWADKRGGGRRLGGLFWCAWQGWLDRETPKARALLDAWAEGMSYAHQQTQKWVQKYLPGSLRGATPEDIGYFVRWFQEEQPVYKTPYLSARDVEDETAFLKLAVQQKLVRALPKNSLWRVIRPR